MTVTMELIRSMIKSMNRGIRMMKSAAARIRRKEKKEIRNERTQNLYSKMRRLRKKNT
jgi:Sec-independent protein translocase protein TatA